MSEKERHEGTNRSPAPSPISSDAETGEDDDLPPTNEHGLTYWHDGLFTVHNTAFMREPRFAEAYAKAVAFKAWGEAEIAWRAHVLCWAADQALKVEGDFVECGVNRGGTATVVGEYVNFPSLPRTFYLLDTFKGLDESVSSETELKNMEGVYADCYDEVVERFASWKNVHIIQGMIPATLDKAKAKRVAFLHIDLNAAEPEVAAMEYFWPKVTPGGMIVLDDYAWVASRAQKKALDAFAADHGFTILSLPTGQGLIVKGPEQEQGRRGWFSR